ncbi:MAG: hypothetical protein AABY84_05875 [Candidatus Firestonebacteria bacterium]
MKKYFLYIMTIILGVTTLAQAEIFSVDTRIGEYWVGSFVNYRTSRVTLGLPFLVSGRIVNGVYNGLGFKGELNNYRIGLQGVYDISVPETGFSIKPFVGFSLSSSDTVSNSISFDCGSDAKFDLIGWLAGAAGAEATIFSDSYMLDYYAGPSFPIIEYITLDVLYTGLLTNNNHKTGFAGRVTFQF